MKVKNGMASRVSFDHHAVDALGQRLQEVGREEAELDADKREEQADGAERERHRVAEEQEEDEAAEHDRRHVDQERPSRPPVQGQASHWHDLLGVNRLLAVRVLDQPAHHRDPLDDLGDALEEQQEEAERDQELGRPLRQPAGIPETARSDTKRS